MNNCKTGNLILLFLLVLCGISSFFSMMKLNDLEVAKVIWIPALVCLIGILIPCRIKKCKCKCHDIIGVKGCGECVVKKCSGLDKN